MKDIIIETASSGTGYIRVGTIIAIASVALAIYLAIYLVRSFAIYKIAKNNGINHAYLAFIPFAWIWTAADACKNPNFFGKRIKRFALYMTIVFSVCWAITAVYEILTYFPLVKYWFEGGVITYYEDSKALKAAYDAGGVLYFENGSIILSAGYQLPYSNPYAMNRFLSVLGIFSSLAQTVSSLFMIVFYVNFFRTYAPMRVLVYSIFSIFGLFPFFAIAVSRKKAVDYNAYMRERYKNIYGAGNPYAARPPYGNPYNNPYGNPYGEQRTQRKPDNEPFSSFSGEEKKNSSDDEPFNDFFDEKGDK